MNALKTAAGALCLLGWGLWLGCAGMDWLWLLTTGAEGPCALLPLSMLGGLSILLGTPLWAVLTARAWLQKRRERKEKR